MRPFIFLLLFLGMSVTFAQTLTGDALTLAEVLRVAPANDPDVLGAEADVAAAQRELTRLQADPLALRVPTLQAEQTLENAQAALEAARLTSRTEVTSAYFDALSAERTLEVAGQDLTIQQATVQATQIRLDAGAATDLELLQAQNALAAAQRSQRNAEQTRALAESELASLVGQDATQLVQISLTPPAVPTLAISLGQAEADNSSVQAASTTVTVAEAQLAAVNNAFSAQTDIDAAQDALTSAQSDLETARRSLELDVRGAHNALSSAERSFKSAKADLSASQDELTAQKARLDAGSLAPISFRAAQLSHTQTEAAMYSALYDFRLAALGLEQTVSSGSTGSSDADTVINGAISDDSSSTQEDTLENTLTDDAAETSSPDATTSDTTLDTTTPDTTLDTTTPDTTLDTTTPDTTLDTTTPDTTLDTTTPDTTLDTTTPDTTSPTGSDTSDTP